jgi:MFS family permease
MRKEFLGFPRAAKLYLASQFLISGYYTWPFWYGYANERISASQFGIYLAVVYIIGLLSEVPTGAFADRYGRKLSATLGAVLSAVIPMIVFVGGNFTAYIFAAVISGIGSAFISGSLESLVHDLPEMNKEVFRKIMVQDTFFYQGGLIISSLLGGLMYSISHVLPFVAQFASFLLAALVIKQLPSNDGIEKSGVDVDGSTKRDRLKEYLSDTKEGFLHLFRVKLLRPLIIFGCTISVLMWMCIEYVNEAAMIDYGLQPNLRGLFIGGSKLVALLFLNIIVVRKIKTDEQKLLYLLFMTSGVFMLYSIGAKSIFLVAFIGFNLVSSTNANYIRPMLHDHIENKWRATAISAYSFVSNLVNAATSIAIGYLLQKQGVIFVQRSLLVLFVMVGIPALLNYRSRLTSR